MASKPESKPRMKPEHGHPGTTDVKGSGPYADPEDNAYPLGGGHLHAAESYFGKNKDSYSPEKRSEIANNIERYKESS